MSPCSAPSGVGITSLTDVAGASLAPVDEDAVGTVPPQTAVTAIDVYIAEEVGTYIPEVPLVHIAREHLVSPHLASFFKNNPASDLLIRVGEGPWLFEESRPLPSRCQL